MTTVAVLADPPREGLVLPRLTETGPLSPAEATDLYTALLRDVCAAVEASGGELLVNYRGDDTLPEEFAGQGDPEAAVRAAVTPALDDPGTARFEIQVGSSKAARVGNTVTHLLEREGVATAAVAEPTAPLLARQVVDNAAMKLRSSEVVLGPASDGRVYYAGFAEPVDFTDSYEPPAVETLTARGVDAGLSVDFLPQQPVVESAADLATAVAMLRARERAGRNRPAFTTERILDLGLTVAEGPDGLALRRE